MSRPIKILIISVGVVAFIGASLGVGRLLVARGAEQTMLMDLITDQNAGRSDRVVAAISGCSESAKCVSAVAALVKQVKDPGASLKVLQIVQGTKLSSGPSTGVSRIAWRSNGRLPVVQCVPTRRTGSVISGFRVEVLAVSKPIAREGSCPKDKPIVTGY